jgi:transcriptional regulator with XRE-family HTH domain
MIYLWRIAKGLSQADAASRFGIAADTWGRWERGAIPVPAWLLRLIEKEASPPPRTRSRSSLKSAPTRADLRARIAELENEIRALRARDS